MNTEAASNIFLKRLNIILSTFIQLFFILISLFFLAVSVFIIYLSNNQEKLNNRIASFLENYLNKTFSIKSDIKNLILLTENREFKILISEIDLKNEALNIKLQDLTFEINYYKLLSLKLYIEITTKSLTGEIKETFTDLKDLFKNSKNDEKQEISLPSLLRFFEFKIQDVDLKTEKRAIKLESFVFEILGVSATKVNFRSNFFIKTENEEPKPFDFMCQFFNAGFDCNFELHSINKSMINNIFELLEEFKIKVRHYVNFLDGEFKNVTGKFIFNEKYEIQIKAITQNVKFLLPFLLNSQEIIVTEGNFVINYKNDVFNSDFELTSIQNKKFLGSVEVSSQNIIVKTKASNLNYEDVANYWPNIYLKDVKAWLTKSIQSGNVSNVEVSVKTPIKNKEDLFVKVWFDNLQLHYSSLLADVINAKGFVTINESEVDVFLEEGFANDVLINNSKALFYPSNSKLVLDLNLSGKFDKFLTFFIPDDFSKSLFKKTIFGDVNSKLTFTSFIKEDDFESFINSEYKGELMIHDIETPIIFNEENITRFKFFKNFNSIFSKVELIKNKQSLRFHEACVDEFLNKMEFNFGVDLKKGDLFFNNLLIESNSEKIKGELEFNFKEKNILSLINLSDVKFCNNNFSVFLNKKENIVNISGKELDLPSLYVSEISKFLKNFETNSSLTQNVSNKFNEITKYNILISLDKILLFNNFKIENLNLNYKENEFTLKSNIASGFKDKNNFNLKILNFGEFVNGFIENKIQFSEGTFEAKSKVKNGEMLNGVFSLKKYNLNLSGTDFSSNLLSGKFYENDDVLIFKDVTFLNLAHSVILNGFLTLNDLNLNMEVFYSPTTFDVYNVVTGNNSYVKNVLNFVTFDTFKNGIVTLNYDVYGPIFNLDIKFRTGSTSKKIFLTTGKITLLVIGANLIIIPLIAILL